MRKLKLQVQMSVDGFMAGANHEMDWMSLNWSDDLIQYVTEITEPVDCILLGRKLAEGFIPYWSAEYQKQVPEIGAEKMALTPKIVFTKSLSIAPWENNILASGNIVDEVNALKNNAGGDLIVYGGSEFVMSLIQHHLIDEFHLIINPIALGSGLPIFKEINTYLHLDLESCKKFDCGIALLKYVLSK